MSVRSEKNQQHVVWTLDIILLKSISGFFNPTWRCIVDQESTLLVMVKRSTMFLL